MKKYIVVFKCEGKRPAFEFPTEADRAIFIDAVMYKNEGMEYTTTEVDDEEETDPEILSA